MRRRIPLAHALLPLVLALALLTRALVPAGWMPSFDGGTLRLVPCPGQGAGALALASEPRHDPGHAGGPGHQHRHGQDRRHTPAGDLPEAHASIGRDDGDAGHHEGDGYDPHQPCTFAGQNLAWPLAPAASDPSQPVAPITLAMPFPAAVAIGRGLAAPPPPSHAPPVAHA